MYVVSPRAAGSRLLSIFGDWRVVVTTVLRHLEQELGDSKPTGQECVRKSDNAEQDFAVYSRCLRAIEDRMRLMRRQVGKW